MEDTKNETVQEIINVDITVQEWRLLEKIRHIKYGEIQELVIRDGLPFKAKIAYKIERFDLDE